MLERKLDGLPVNVPIRALLSLVGTALRQIDLELLTEPGVAPAPKIGLDGRRFGFEDALGDAGIAVIAMDGRDDLPPAPTGGWSEKQLHTLMNDFAQSDLSRPGFSLRRL